MSRPENRFTQKWKFMEIRKYDKKKGLYEDI